MICVLCLVWSFFHDRCLSTFFIKKRVFGLEFVTTSLEEAELLASIKDGAADLVAAAGHVDDG